MKISIDNQNPYAHKMVTIQDSNADGIIEYLNVVCDSLKALGVSEGVIQNGFLLKCEQWELIDPLDPEELL